MKFSQGYVLLLLLFNLILFPTSKCLLLTRLPPCVLPQKVNVGKNVVILGGGGIAFDMAEFLLTPKHNSHDKNNYDPELIDRYYEQWGIDKTLEARGGITAMKPNPRANVTDRKVVLLARTELVRRKRNG